MHILKGWSIGCKMVKEIKKHTVEFERCDDTFKAIKEENGDYTLSIHNYGTDGHILRYATILLDKADIKRFVKYVNSKKSKVGV